MNIREEREKVLVDSKKGKRHSTYFTLVLFT